jgi:sigma-B regulation protein RsbU (phosphoserine phosphatase)
VVSGETGEYHLLQAGGTVVGLFPDSEYARGSAKLKLGDILVLCTDGITEPCNLEEEEFGSERLADCVSRNRHKTADQIIEAVHEEVNAFSFGGVHTDDKVLMLLKVTEGGIDSGTLRSPSAKPSHSD